MFAESFGGACRPVVQSPYRRPYLGRRQFQGASIPFSLEEEAMNKLILAGAAVAALAAIPAAAQMGGERAGPKAGPLTRAAVQADVQARFAKADANRDGYITAEEARARAGAAREEMRERF